MFKDDFYDILSRFHSHITQWTNPCLIYLRQSLIWWLSWFVVSGRRSFSEETIWRVVRCGFFDKSHLQLLERIISSLDRNIWYTSIDTSTSQLYQSIWSVQESIIHPKHRVETGWRDFSWTSSTSSQPAYQRHHNKSKLIPLGRSHNFLHVSLKYTEWWLYEPLSTSTFTNPSYLNARFIYTICINSWRIEPWGIHKASRWSTQMKSTWIISGYSAW